MSEKLARFEFKRCGDPNGSRPFGVTDEERQQEKQLAQFIMQSMYKSPAHMLWDKLCLKFHCAVFGPLKGSSDHSHIASDYIYKTPEDFFRRIGIEEDIADKDISGKPFLFPTHAPEGQHQTYFPQWGVVTDPVEQNGFGSFMDKGATKFEIGGLYSKITLSIGPVLDGENEGAFVLNHAVIHNGNDTKVLEIENDDPDYDPELIETTLNQVGKIVHAIDRNDPDTQSLFDHFDPIYKHLAERRRQRTLCDEDEVPAYKPFSRLSP